MNKEPDWKSIAKNLADRLIWLLSCPLRLGMTIDTSDASASEYTQRSARDIIADDLDQVPGIKIDRELSNAMELPPKERRAFVAKWKAKKAATQPEHSHESRHLPSPSPSGH